MSACMCNAFGRALWDDPYRQFFFSDPVAACRVYDPTSESRGLRALSKSDFKVLDQQFKSIREALGEETLREVSENFGLQFILGRAMLDPSFAKRLNRDAEGVIRELLGPTKSAQRAASVFQSKQFKTLNGFAAQRAAMKEAGERFSLGVAHGSAAQSL
jgi:hypothetical protein